MLASVYLIHLFHLFDDDGHLRRPPVSVDTLGELLIGQRPGLLPRLNALRQLQLQTPAGDGLQAQLVALAEHEVALERRRKPQLLQIVRDDGPKAKGLLNGLIRCKALSDHKKAYLVHLPPNLGPG